MSDSALSRTKGQLGGSPAANWDSGLPSAPRTSSRNSFSNSRSGPQGDPGPQGPQGEQGPAGADGTGVNILGSFPTENDLPGTGDPGDAYLVQGDLYVWSENNNDWENVGNIRPP